MVSRWDVEKAIFRSNLPAPARLIVLSLLALSDAESAVVPGKFSPSLSRLAEATGLNRATVARQLNALEELGWAKRSRPSIEAARASKERTAYALAIGRNAPPKPGNASRTMRLVAEDDQPNQDKTPSDDWSQSATSRTGRLELVAEDDQSERGASRRVRHIPDHNLLPDLPTTSARPKSRGRKPKTSRCTDSEANAARVVAAYFDGAKEAGQPRPAGHLPQKVGRDAKTLLADKVNIDDLIEAARAMGRAGWNDLAVQLQRTAAERNPRASPRRKEYRDGDRNDLSDYDGYFKEKRS